MNAPRLGFHHVYRQARASAPTFLLLHGTGGDEHELLPVAEALWPGAGVLSPRGKVLEDGSPRFFRRLAPGVFDVPDLEARTRELETFVRGAMAAYGVPPARVIAVGFSNGATTGASLLLTAAGLLRSAVLFRGALPLPPRVRPDLRGVGVYIGAARDDDTMGPEGTERLAAVLRDAGADVALQWDSGGHQLSPPVLAPARQWLRERVDAPHDRALSGRRNRAPGRRRPA